MDAPLHQIAQDNPTISDWQIRYTINGESLTLKDWESIYIEGLKPGRNWVQLTLVDESGSPIKGVFNNIDKRLIGTSIGIISNSQSIISSRINHWVQ